MRKEQGSAILEGFHADRSCLRRKEVAAEELVGTDQLEVRRSR